MGKDDIESNAVLHAVSFALEVREAVTLGDRVLLHGGTDAGPGYNDFLYAIDSTTGDVLWRFGGRLQAFDLLSPVVVHAGVAFVGRMGGTLSGIDVATGETALQKHFSGAPMPMPIAIAPIASRGAAPYRSSAGDAALIVAGGGALHRMAVSDGVILERRACDDDLLAGVATADGSVLLSSRRTVTRISSLTLEEEWQRKLEFPLASPAIAIGGRFLLHFSDGPIAVCDLQSGRVLGRLPATKGGFRRPCTDGRTLFYLTTDDVVGACELDTLTPRWHRRFPGATAIAQEEGRLAVETSEGVMVLNGETGQVVHRAALGGDPVPPLTVTGGMAFVRRGSEPRLMVHAVHLESARTAWECAIGGYALT